MADAGLSRLAFLIVSCVVGCAQRVPAPAPASSSEGVGSTAEVTSTTPPARSAPPAESFAGGFRIIEATGQGLEFPLPDARGWRRDRRETRSWVARHRATASSLVVRAWRHDAIARIEDCERQARLWRPELPELAQGELIDTRQQQLAGAYAGEVKLFLRRSKETEAGPITGHALAFGSDARSCLMMAFSTTAAGPSAERAIAQRLGAVAEAVFGRARRLDIGERVVVPRM